MFCHRNDNRNSRGACKVYLDRPILPARRSTVLARNSAPRARRLASSARFRRLSRPEAGEVPCDVLVDRSFRVEIQWPKIAGAHNRYLLDSVLGGTLSLYHPPCIDPVAYKYMIIRRLSGEKRGDSKHAELFLFRRRHCRQANKSPRPRRFWCCAPGSCA